MSPICEPPCFIFERVNHKIRRAEIVRLRIISSAYALGSFLALGVFAFTISRLFQLLSESGTFDYLSTTITDSSSSLANWKQMTLSILNSLPMTEIIIVTASILFILNAFEQIRKYFSRMKTVEYRVIKNA